jgi:AcrR family transcriptional regulator
LRRRRLLLTGFPGGGVIRRPECFYRIVDPFILTVQSKGGKKKPTSRFFTFPPALSLLEEEEARNMQQRSEETRARILDSSVKLFSGRGFNAASVDEICAEAGISKGAFYHHFESKHALFLALLDGWLKTIDTAVENTRDATAPETFSRMTEAFPYIFETAGEGLPMFLEFWLQASRDKKIWQASIAPYRRYHKYFTSLIKKGVAEGSFAEVNPEIASRMIISMAMGLLLQSLLDPEGANWEKVSRECTMSVVGSLQRKEPG